MQILLAEDERRMAALLRAALEEEGYRTSVVWDGRAALDLASLRPFSLIILDVMLPQMDGFTVARELRKRGNQSPILMLTARDENSDAIAGLDAGADDYVTKPFSLDVLLARVRAVSRRGHIPQGVLMSAADLSLDTATRQATRAGHPIRLTPREYGLLSLLLRNKDKVVSRETILDEVWGHQADVDANTIEAFIRLLRAKLEQPPAAKLIFTIRGVGYSLREPAA